MKSGGIRKTEELPLTLQNPPEEDLGNGVGEDSATADFMRRLLEAGLIREIKPPVSDLAPYQDYEPVGV